MKRILLLIAIMISSNHLFAQIIFFEDFNNVPGPTAGGAGTYSFPSGWRLRNVDNRMPDAQVAYINEAWERREDFGLNVADSVAFSTSYYNPVGGADDWMWTPLIGPIPSNTILSWVARSYDQSYKDGYEVRIMVAPNTPTGGTGLLGNQVSASTVLFSIAEENSTNTLRSVDLNAYSGQSVYIGFRNNSNDKFILIIDDVKLEVMNLFDARLVSIDTVTEYTQVPVSQAHPLTLSGNIINNGLDTISNVRLNVEISTNNQIVYSAQSNGTTILPGQTTKLSIQEFIPSTQGNYLLKFYTSINELDENNNNDTLTKTIFISDSTLARDNGIISGSLGIGAGNGYIGQSFNVSKTDYITSITGSFNRGYANRKLAALVWDFSNNIPNQIIARTDTITYLDDSARYYTLPIQGGYKLLDSGMYAITFIEFDSILTLSLSSEYFSPKSTWVYWNAIPGNTWRNFEYFGQNFAKSCIVRPNFGELPCNTQIEIDTLINVSCNGNSDAEIYLNVSNFNGELIYDWTPNVSDTSFAIGLAAGQYSVTVTDEFNCSKNLIINIQEPPVIDTNIIIRNDTLFSMAMSNNYQWINCSDNAIIPNQTFNFYVPSTNGIYAVIIGDDVCKDTSECINYFINSVSIAENKLISIYPNPNNGTFTIKTSNKNALGVIYNSLGTKVNEFELTKSNNFIIEIKDLSSGIYFINTQVDGEISSNKIIIR